jgi:outer membrane protein assembly factor BamB
LFFLSALLAQDWPRFRGPNGSGVGDGTHLPQIFGPYKNLAWKIETPPGHSSPVIVGNTIYLTSFEEKALLTLAYDRQTGKRLWLQKLARERMAKHNSLNNAASPSPAADAEGVISFFQDYGLIAYSPEGKLQWKVSCEPLINNHGMSSSPILAGGVVIQVLGGDTGSTVLALNRFTGRTVWKASLSAVTYSTPVILEKGGEPSAVAIVSTGEVIALNLRDGSRIWWVRGVPYQPKASPIVSADGRFVFVAVPTVSEESMRLLADFDNLLKMWDVNGDGKITQSEVLDRKGPASGFPQIDLNGDGYFTREEHADLMKIASVPHLMAAIPSDAEGDATNRIRWVYRKSVPNVPTPLVYKGVFYAIKEGGIATAFDVESGEVIKEGRLTPSFGAMFASPVAGDGKIYAVNQAGKVAVLKGVGDWELLAINDLQEDCFATPALSGDRIIIRSSGHLWCFRDFRNLEAHR